MGIVAPPAAGWRVGFVGLTSEKPDECMANLAARSETAFDRPSRTDTYGYIDSWRQDLNMIGSKPIPYFKSDWVVPTSLETVGNLGSWERGDAVNGFERGPTDEGLTEDQKHSRHGSRNW